MEEIQYKKKRNEAKLIDIVKSGLDNHDNII